MFRPLSLFIGLRYTRSKKRNHFVSFISLLSVLGIALGVLVLITVLSVMNGFDQQITQKVFSMVPSITVTSLEGNIDDSKTIITDAKQLGNVSAAAPFVSGQGLLQNNGKNLPVYVTGVNPDYGSKIIDLDNKMIEGNLKNLKPGSFGIVLGEGIAYRLGVTKGDKLILITPQLNVSPVGVMPRLKRFTVVGIFHASGSFGYDDSLALINLKDAQILYQLNDSVTGVQMKLADPFLAQRVADQLTDKLSVDDIVNTWASQYGNFFHAIKMEKTMMFFILLLIVAVATFNLVSMLVMVVNEKQADIAILKTYGASTGMIMRVFIIQGLFLGVFGTLLGVVGGIALSLNVTSLVNWLQNVLHTQFVSADVYFVDFLPSQLQWVDVWHIGAVAVVLSLLATLYPAWRGAKVDPAKALRYE